MHLPAFHEHLTTFVPWGTVTMIVGTAVAAVVAVALLGLPFLRAGTRVEDFRTE